MSFFSQEEKTLSYKYSKRSLKRKYEDTEKRLKNACKSGNIKNIEKAMKVQSMNMPCCLKPIFKQKKKL